MKKRVFSQDELDEMGTPTSDLLKRAVDAGEGERAKRLAERLHNEFLAMHDLYVDWVAGLMDYVCRNDGEDALYQALKGVIGTPGAAKSDTTKPSQPQTEVDEEASLRRRVRTLAFALRGHLFPIKVEEDDEKVCLTMEPCGSGQRLLERGAYEPPRSLTKIQKPHAMTWGLRDFPVYCTHAPILEILSIEALGYPATVAVPAEKVATKACTYCIYKNTGDIPEEYYTRVGKVKPQGG